MVVVVAGIVVVVGTVGLIVVTTSAVVDTAGRRVVLGVGLTSVRAGARGQSRKRHY